jgi:hypothetical protein
MVLSALALGAMGLLCSKLAGPLSIAATTATFIAVLWYAIETRRLVLGQERTVEISRHPWLEATTLKPEVRRSGDWEFPLDGYHVWLPITNVGNTPAVELEIDSSLRALDPAHPRPQEGLGRRVG